MVVYGPVAPHDRASVGFTPAAVKPPLGPPRAPGGGNRLSTVFSTARALLLQRIEALERHVAQLHGDVATLKTLLADASARVERGSTVTLRSDLDNLVGRVETLATSNRKELGRLWYLLRDKTPAGGRAEDGIPTDSELAEQIRLQREWSGGNGSDH